MLLQYVSTIIYQVQKFEVKMTKVIKNLQDISKTCQIKIVKSKNITRK